MSSKVNVFTVTIALLKQLLISFVLKIHRHCHLVNIVTGFERGRNLFSFSRSFVVKERWSRDEHSKVWNYLL